MLYIRIFLIIYVIYLFINLVFSGPHSWHMEIPRLAVKLELQLLAYATATPMRHPTHTCDLHHSSRQRQILKPLSEARDRTCVLMHTSQICFRWVQILPLYSVSKGDNGELEKKKKITCRICFWVRNFWTSNCLAIHRWFFSHVHSFGKVKCWEKSPVLLVGIALNW